MGPMVTWLRVRRVRRTVRAAARLRARQGGGGRAGGVRDGGGEAPELERRGARVGDPRDAGLGDGDAVLPGGRPPAGGDGGDLGALPAAGVRRAAGGAGDGAARGEARAVGGGGGGARGGHGGGGAGHVRARRGVSAVRV